MPVPDLRHHADVHVPKRLQEQKYKMLRGGYFYTKPTHFGWISVIKSIPV